jgi:hypothetical protein
MEPPGPLLVRARHRTRGARAPQLSIPPGEVRAPRYVPKAMVRRLVFAPPATSLTAFACVPIIPLVVVS